MFTILSSYYLFLTAWNSVAQFFFKYFKYHIPVVENIKDLKVYGKKKKKTHSPSHPCP